jgi:hypothetical protein
MRYTPWDYLGGLAARSPGLSKSLPLGGIALMMDVLSSCNSSTLFSPWSLMTYTSPTAEALTLLSHFLTSQDCWTGLCLWPASSRKYERVANKALLSASSAILLQRGSDSNRQMHMPLHSPQAKVVLNHC